MYVYLDNIYIMLNVRIYLDVGGVFILNFKYITLSILLIRNIITLEVTPQKLRGQESRVQESHFQTESST